MGYIKTNAERETIIRRAADEQMWTVFSEDPRVIRKITRAVGAGEAKGLGFEWNLPPAALSFRKPRVLGAEQRAALAGRLAKARGAVDG